MNLYWYQGIITEEPPLIPADSRLVKYGDGFFETIRIWNSQALFLHEHLDRLSRSCELYGIQKPDKACISENIEKLISEYPEKSARLRLTCFRMGRGLYTPEENSPGILLEITKASEILYPLEFVSTGIIENVIIHPGILSSVKSLSAANFVIASLEAMEQNWETGIMLNSFGRIADGTAYNVFIINGNTLNTPSLEEGALPGIMRSVIIKLAEKNFIIRETQITPSQLLDSEEIFITNAIKGIVSVKCVGSTPKSIHEKTTRLSHELRRVVELI